MKLAVYTSIFGEKDFPIPQPLCKDVFLVTDNVRSKHHTVIPGLYTQRGRRRDSRHAKMLPHLYFPDYEYSLYIDGHLQIVRDPILFAEKYLKNSTIAQYVHLPDPPDYPP